MTVSDQLSSTGMAYASVGRRIGAYLMDGVVGLLLLVVVGGVPVLVTGEPTAITAGYAGAVVLGLVQWYLLGTRGYTIGKLILGIRVVDADTGTPIGMGRAFLRYLVLALAASCLVVLAVMLALLVKDPRRQGWHDKAARSVEVDAARGGAAATAPASDMESASAPVPTPGVTSSRPVPPTAVAPPAPLPPSAAPPLPSGGLVGPPPGLVSTPPAPQGRPAAAVPPVPPPLPPMPAREPAEPVVDELTRRPDSGRREATPPPVRRWVLRPSAGAAMTVEGPTLVGRDPDAALHDQAALWPVDDPAFTVSKTHALVTLVDQSLWIEDLDSTHGVVIRRKGDEATLDRRKPTRLLPGDTVVLGVFEIAVEGGS